MVGVTFCRPFNDRDAEATETPASRATSRMVTARVPGAPRTGRLIGRRPRPSGLDSDIGANACATAFQALPERSRVSRTSSAFRDLASRCEDLFISAIPM